MATHHTSLKVMQLHDVDVVSEFFEQQCRTLSESSLPWGVVVVIEISVRANSNVYSELQPYPVSPLNNSRSPYHLAWAKLEKWAASRNLEVAWETRSHYEDNWYILKVKKVTLAEHVRGIFKKSTSCLASLLTP